MAIPVVGHGRDGINWKGMNRNYTYTRLLEIVYNQFMKKKKPILE